MSRLSSAAATTHYFEKDGYYAKDDPERRAASAWFGRGAAEYGLGGAVDKRAFARVLEGYTPEADAATPSDLRVNPRFGRLGRVRNGVFEHMPGTDLTFSAPKSVSIMALVGGDRRIVDQHDAAMAKTLRWIEDNVLETRIWDKDLNKPVKCPTNRMVAATFRHDTSRNQDPQLHTHCVVANMTHGPEDGRWRTIENESLFRHKMLAGAIMRAYLIRDLQDLGYRFALSGRGGLVELENVPKEVLEAFSTRTREIKKSLIERGIADPSAAQKAEAALLTRAAKTDVDRAALWERWQQTARELGFAPETRKARETDISPRDPAPAADAAVAHAVAHLSERYSVFGWSQIVLEALTHAIRSCVVEEVAAALDRAVARGLLKSPNAESEATPEARDRIGTLYTTPEALALERETIALIRSGHGAGARLWSDRAARAALSGSRLTEGQREAAATIAASPDRFVGVQGLAGTGKTTMLRRAVDMLADKGCRVAGLAPSASAAATLGRETGIKAETLQRFLARNAGFARGDFTDKGLAAMRGKYRTTVLAVDESSMISTRQMRDLLKIATLFAIPRVALVGDARQLDGVEAGKPFAQLQKAGMETAHMRDIVRQRDPETLAAVVAAAAGDVKTAFAKLGSNVLEIGEREQLHKVVAEAWLSLPPERRRETGLMVPSNTLREAVNMDIRDGLRFEGRLRGETLRNPILAPLGLSLAEKGLAGNYKVGDVVRFNRDYESLSVAKDDYRTVDAADPDTGVVRLAGGEAPVDWSPHKVAGRTRGAVEVFEPATMPLQAGDAIRWTRNDNANGLYNGQTATVAAVGADGSVTIRDHGGDRTILLPGDAPQLRHMDYAWAGTVHAFQGRTTARVVAALEAGNPHLTNQKMFYVEISRARDAAVLITDDAERLRNRLERATGERIAALDLMSGERQERTPADVDAGGASGTAEPVGERDGPAPQMDLFGGGQNGDGGRAPTSGPADIGFALQDIPVAAYRDRDGGGPDNRGPGDRDGGQDSGRRRAPTSGPADIGFTLQDIPVAAYRDRDGRGPGDRGGDRESGGGDRDGGRERPSDPEPARDRRPEPEAGLVL